MKRITFKKPFNGFGNALKLIPEGYRVEGKEFVMTDNNETYQIKWSNGKGNIITASDNKVVKEDFNRLKQLMNYKSEDTLGLVKGENRISENKRFNKSIISEDLGVKIDKSPEETKGAKIYANPDKHKELGKMLSNDDEEKDDTNEGIEPICDCEKNKK